MMCFTSSLTRQQTLIMCCCNWWALTLRTVCVNTEWAMGMWHSWLKHLNCWWKAVKNLICYSCIFRAQLHVHLKKWILKFKLLYPRNYISHFNKICRICWANIRIQSLKVWRKFVLPWLKYSIFARGLFFYWRTLYIYINQSISMNLFSWHHGSQKSESEPPVDDCQ